MKTLRFSDTQVIAILKQAEVCSPVPELCREHAILQVAIQRVDQQADFGDVTLSPAKSRHLPIVIISANCRKKSSSQLATSPQQQIRIEDYRAPKPVRMVRMVLNTMSTSSQREKCLI